MINHAKVAAEPVPDTPLMPATTDPHEWAASAAGVTHENQGGAPSTTQQRQTALLVQRALAPFVGELERTRQELSRERQSRIAAEARALAAEEQARSTAQRAVVAEWRVALLRGELMGSQPQRRGWWPWSRH